MEERIKEIIYFNKKGILVFILILLVIGGSIFTFFITTPKNKVEAEIDDEITIVKDNKEKKEEIKTCYFDIKGKIKKEGVYQIECDKRVIDAIKLAGGITKDADTSMLNLSKKIVDSMVIKIYSKSEVKNYLKTIETDTKKQELCQNDQIKNDACIENKEVTTNSNLININTATLEELMTLTGIGESRAKAIIDYRNQTPFKSIEDIKNVSGIGESMYAKIKENITV